MRFISNRRMAQTGFYAPQSIRSTLSVQRSLSTRATMTAHDVSQPHQARGKLQQGHSLRTFSTTPFPAAANHQTPNVPSPETETLYVLTLNVTPTLDAAMNSLRKTYFPPHLNRLAAHLTLFHALPYSQLDASIMPLLRQLANKTPSYHIRAGTTTRMRRGVLIKAQHSDSPHRTDELHRQMQRAWGHFLSHQDKQNLRLHWTVMNKVDDPNEVTRAEREVNEWLKQRRKSKHPHERKDVEGWVIGMTLWMYSDGIWIPQRVFKFRGSSQLRQKAQAAMRQEQQYGRDLIEEVAEVDADQLEDIDEHDVRRMTDLEGQDEEADIARSAAIFAREVEERERAKLQALETQEPKVRLTMSERQSRAAEKRHKVNVERNAHHAQRWKRQQQAIEQPELQSTKKNGSRWSLSREEDGDGIEAKVRAAPAMGDANALSEREQESRAQQLGVRSGENLARLMAAVKRASVARQEDQKGTEK